MPAIAARRSCVMVLPHGEDMPPDVSTSRAIASGSRAGARPWCQRLAPRKEGASHDGEFAIHPCGCDLPSDLSRRFETGTCKKLSAVVTPLPAKRGELEGESERKRRT